MSLNSVRIQICFYDDWDPPLVFWPLLKISLINPYLKILDLAKLFVADAPIKKQIKKSIVTPSQST